MEIESVIETKSEQLLLKAIHFGASDIHIVPTEENYSVSFRRYGKLFPTESLTFNLGDRLISYFKFKSSLDISEKRKPQSGSFQEAMEKDQYSFRVSTLPSFFKRESLVIRLLLQNTTHSISSLCFNQQSAKKLIDLVSSRQGLLLFSGATGSGKTTTLYSLVNYCSDSGRHVISLEDPVESSHSRLLQIQVNERAGITYAAGLKAILRHSPDVIMIGEIRDQETAKIAVEASLTGHLVLSTIHSKDTINCLYRLMDLGISLEEIRQSLVGIVAQTLIQPNGSDERKAIYEVLSDVHLYEAFLKVARGEDYQLPHEETLQYQAEALEVVWHRA